MLAAGRCAAQWPFSTPAARAAATPFAGFEDTGSTGAEGAPARDIPLVEVPFSQLSNQQVDELGQQALAIRPEAWKHAETDNFILHYRRATEARKVAREVEFDLWFVAKRLGATREQYARKSHVFIFEDDQEWHQFLATISMPSWVGSFARRDDLFLNLRETGGTGEPFDSRTLAHETTHAVVARVYPDARWPLWLSEGFAEYMGAASVAARKGQTLQRHEHTLIFAGLPLEELTSMQHYPQDPVQVAQLYESAEKLVRFVMTALPPERFTQFMEAVVHGAKLQEALLSVYPDKLASYDDFLKKYAHFTK